MEALTPPTSAQPPMMPPTAPETEKKREPDDGEKKQVAIWNRRIERALKATDKRRKLNKVLRQYVLGRQAMDDATIRDPDEVRANLILGIMQTLIPLYYAKDPELDISPAEQVDDQGYEALNRFARTLDLVLRRELMRVGGMKARITRSIASAMTTGLCWLKVTFQEDYAEDPLARNRLNDAQDNLARIQHLIREVKDKDGGDCGDLEAKQKELDEQVAQLQQQVEILVGKAFAIDVVFEDDLLILDESLTTFSEYATAGAIAQGVWMTEEQYEERYGKDPTGSKHDDKTGERAPKLSEVGKDGAAVKYVRVYEIWDRKANLVRTMERGAKEWARPPYSPKTSRRFYPYFAVAWNEFDADPDNPDLFPVSDVEQMIGLQDEYIAMRTQLAQARKENKPGFVARAGGAITEEDAANIANRKGRTVVFINTNGSQAPLNQDMAPFPTFPIDATAYDSTPILRDLEQVSGASDASRAAINRAKTATEAEIQAQGMQSRTSYRQDKIEDLIAEIAEHAAQLAVQCYSPEEVKRIAGPGAVWPQMPRQDIYDLVQIQVKAGSTGKPNQNRDREQWMQLAPQIREFITQVREMRMMGDMQGADGVLELLKETLKRFDIRLELDQFFGSPAEAMMQGPQGMPGMPGMPPGLPAPGGGAGPMPPQGAMPPGPPQPQQGMPPMPMQQPPGPPMPGGPAPQLPVPAAGGRDGMAGGLQQFVDQIYAQAQAEAGSGVEAMQAVFVQHMQMMAQVMDRLAQAAEMQAAVARAPRVPIRDPQTGLVVASVPDLGAAHGAMPPALPPGIQ